MEAKNTSSVIIDTINSFFLVKKEGGFQKPPSHKVAFIPWSKSWHQTNGLNFKLQRAALTKQSQNVPNVLRLKNLVIKEIVL